jgi:hypothetical protein
MTKILITFISISCSFLCEAIPQGYALQLDSSAFQRVCIVEQSTRKEVGINDVLRTQGLEKSRDIPSSREAFEAYYKQYLQSNPDTLKYASDFWIPAERSKTELLFCCLNGNMISCFIEKVRPFLEFINSSDDFFFKIDIVSKYFKNWNEAVLDLEETLNAHNYGECKGLCISIVRSELNSLLSIVDNEHLIIKWCF